MENTSSENKSNNNIIEEINQKLKINIDKYDNINKELSVVQSVENDTKFLTCVKNEFGYKYKNKGFKIVVK